MDRAADPHLPNDMGCNLMFRINPDQFPTNQAKIYYILSFMKDGTAKDFKQWAMLYYADEAAYNWTDFKDCF